MSMTDNAKIYYLTQVFTLVILASILMLGLLPALLGGLLVYFLVELGARQLGRTGILPSYARLIFLALITLLSVTGIAFAVMGSASFISEGPESLVVLLQRMADIVEKGRSYLPMWSHQYVPANMEEWQAAASTWLRENAGHFSLFGKELGVFLVHLVFGMIIGGMIAIRPAFQEVHGPLGKALRERVTFLSRAFSRIVFSQVRISALNAFLTGIFLAVILPLTGNPLPLTKTMIAVTFFVGLLPIIGNLISNTVIFLIALSVSPMAAIGSLIFLIVIHKLEYFFNAHIIGAQIKSRAWEILLAMMVMEALFGIAGVVAAPIYYAYLKDELTAKKLI